MGNKDHFRIGPDTGGKGQEIHGTPFIQGFLRYAGTGMRVAGYGTMAREMLQD